MATITKSPPWETFRNMLNALFAGDADILVSNVVDSGDNKKVSIRVSDSNKYEALKELLPEWKEFGNVQLNIVVVPANNPKSRADLYRTLFKENASVSRIVDQETIPGVCSTYVVFSPKIVQFYDDNIADLNGNKTTVLEDVAREVFHDPSVYFCTEKAV